MSGRAIYLDADLRNYLFRQWHQTSRCPVLQQIHLVLPNALDLTNGHYVDKSTVNLPCKMNGAVAGVSTVPNDGLHAVNSSSSAVHKYRGAVVEDLQLPPAFALPQTENIARAIELAYDRDFSHIPILSKQRKPLGYIDVAALKAKWEAGEADPTDNVVKYMTKFRRGPSQTYTLITPDTPLHELEEFLQHNLFALVTDYERKFVLAVATQSDLHNFITRSGL